MPFNWNKQAEQSHLALTFTYILYILYNLCHFGVYEIKFNGVSSEIYSHNFLIKVRESNLFIKEIFAYFAKEPLRVDFTKYFIDDLKFELFFF